MRRNGLLTLCTVVAILVTVGLYTPPKVYAHCDGLDGPVVRAARKALETGNISLVLIWVQEKDEAEIKGAFQKTVAVRKLSPEAQELANMYFFETLVRLHRAGEGAPYTGLKPAGRDLGPAIPAADKALEDGAAEALLKLLTSTLHNGVLEQFKHALAKKNFGKDDVRAGREYVEAYVTFIHYVELLYAAAQSPVGGHYRESTAEGASEERKC
ncbi:MAG TPA: DUF6448 family protein [Candidatus Tectomicrobia bacterium]|jgi:hypothetical protein